MAYGGHPSLIDLNQQEMASPINPHVRQLDPLEGPLMDSSVDPSVRPSVRPSVSPSVRPSMNPSVRPLHETSVYQDTSSRSSDASFIFSGVRPSGQSSMRPSQPSVRPSPSPLYRCSFPAEEDVVTRLMFDTTSRLSGRPQSLGDSDSARTLHQLVPVTSSASLSIPVTTQPQYSQAAGLHNQIAGSSQYLSTAMLRPQQLPPRYLQPLSMQQPQQPTVRFTDPLVCRPESTYIVPPHGSSGRLGRPELFHPHLIEYTPCTAKSQGMKRVTQPAVTFYESTPLIPYSIATPPDESQLPLHRRAYHTEVPLTVGDDLISHNAISYSHRGNTGPLEDNYDWVPMDETKLSSNPVVLGEEVQQNGAKVHPAPFYPDVGQSDLLYKNEPTSTDQNGCHPVGAENKGAVNALPLVTCV